MTASKIEWTDRTWNPTTGCTKVSPGCDHCYAEGIARRFAGSKAFPNGFDVTLHPERLDAPLHWRKPARVFVNSMSDLFHDDIPDEFIVRVFAVMAATPQHTYQILTKRHARMRSFLRDVCRCGSGHGDGIHLRSKMSWAATPHSPTYVPGIEPGLYHRITWPLPNVWLGVSVEDQKRADLRIPALLDTPAAVRFLSCEPLLGPVDLTPWLACPHLSSIGDEGPAAALGREVRRWRCDWCATIHGQDAQGDRLPERRGLGWVIAGGESGPGARPMHPDWARQLRDDCQDTGVPFFFKQHGEWLGVDQHDPRYTGPVKGGYVKHDGTGWAAFTLPVPEAPAWVLRVGKKAAGRELDGRTWDEFPVST